MSRYLDDVRRITEEAEKENIEYEKRVIQSQVQRALYVIGDITQKIDKEAKKGRRYLYIMIDELWGPRNEASDKLVVQQIDDHLRQYPFLDGFNIHVSDYLGIRSVTISW